MAQVPIPPPLAPTVSGVEPAAAGFGGLGHVDHLLCGDGGIAEGHGTRAESGAGKDRRRPNTLYRHFLRDGHRSLRRLQALKFGRRRAYSSDTRAPPWRSSRPARSRSSQITRTIAGELPVKRTSSSCCLVLDP